MRLWDLATGRCLHNMEGHTDSVNSVAITPDGRFALSGDNEKTLILWEFKWEYEFPEVADWDEGARPYLIAFLSLRTPYEAPESLTRKGTPTWTEDDFQEFIVRLQHAGYGWLRPEGVRAEIERMAKGWNGPPPLPFEENQ